MSAMVPDLANFQHGRERIWCLDCHHTTKRNMLIDNFGDPVSFDQPQLLCGKCHGDKLRDWRDGIHGKRIGEFTSSGKKRWFTCTECHNPHNVQDGQRNRGFIQLQPEPSPQLPRGLVNADHEKVHPIPNH
jgi:Zn finger protein HypA/HybF involved in hydrogenase expression